MDVANAHIGILHSECYRLSQRFTKAACVSYSLLLLAQRASVQVQVLGKARQRMQPIARGLQQGKR